MSRFTVTDTSIQGLKVVERQNLGDHRGFFSRLFCADELSAAGWTKPIAQVNQSLTKKKGTVRGMHYQQEPDEEMKLVNCLKGAVWDVAVDLRAGSPTFLQWHAEELSADNLHALLIPEGVAHGFQALTNDAELLYFHSAPFSPGAEAGLNPQDPTVAICWPLEVGELSHRDNLLPFVDSEFTGVGT